MGLLALCGLRFTALFMCAMLSLLTLAFPTEASPVGLPRSLLLDGRPHLATPVARPPLCETNCTIHFEKEHGLNIKATSTPSSSSSSSSSSCQQTYGFMPCTHSIIGGIFLLFVYSYIIFRAAKLLVEGSELLLLVLGSSIVGGLLLPILGVLPDSILILVSGVGGTKEEAQREVLIGIGLLAGSNVMLLTLLWGTCLILGRCDLSQDSNGNHAIDKILTKKFSLFGTGVEIDTSTQHSAGIMCISIIPFLVVQIPQIFHVRNSIPILMACLVSLALFLTYCIFQLTRPHHTKKKQLKALHDVIFFELLKLKSEEEKLIYDDGRVNEEVLERMFDKMDSDNDKSLTRNELQALLTISYFNQKLNDFALDLFMKYFDTNNTNTISWREFLDGMQRWCKQMKPTKIYSLEGQSSIKMENLQKELQENMSLKEEMEAPTKAHLQIKSTMLILFGTLLVGLFAEPLVDTIGDFAQSSHIPSFFVSFVLLPLASNTSESISSIMFSSRKKKVNMSLTYSQIYGAVTLNNTLSLGIFLAIIYSRHLVWEFSSEVLIIMLVTLVIGIITLISKVLPLWIGILALCIYPLSIGLVAILDYVVGWN